jgi:prepilin-type N-terminal cleavage/methylation domain-containing protein
VVPAGVRRLDPSGFGLVELVVVLFLLALVSTVAAPSLVGYWRSATLRAATQEVAGALVRARQLAIALNTPICVAVGGDAVRFSQPGGGGACSESPIPGTSGQAAHLSAWALVTKAGPDVVFTHLGGATPGGTYTVIDPASGRAGLVVVAGSGRVSIR